MLLTCSSSYLLSRDNADVKVKNGYSLCSFAVYVNHRPAFGLSPFDLNEAFTKLGMPSDEGFVIDRDRLLTLLQNKGMAINLLPQRREFSLG